MNFKEWLKLQEVGTGTNAVAMFKRPVFGEPIRRQALGPWAEEDPFFKKRHKNILPEMAGVAGSIFIFWNGKYQGKVGSGIWVDQFIVNTLDRIRYGQCCFIDGISVADAKTHLNEVQPTTIPNLFVYGDNAINVLKKQGGNVV